MQKTAFIAIVGCPNVGKSSILNRMLGQKIAIVSNKPQTTRTKIMGVLTVDETQLVFTDTPGFHRPKTKLGEKMIKAVSDSIGGVDACLMVVEGLNELQDSEKELIEKFRKQKMPVVLAINKIDLIENKEELMGRIMSLVSEYNFEAVVPVSAAKNDGINELLSELMKLAFPSEHFFPDDTLTDQPERVIASEMIREKMLRLLDKEIPHGVAVVIEEYREEEGLVTIRAEIFCEKSSHKGILVGKGGETLKRIGSYAREDLERMLECRVYLNLWVKVKENWRDSLRGIGNFGFTED